MKVVISAGYIFLGVERDRYASYASLMQAMQLAWATMDKMACGREGVVVFMCLLAQSDMRVCMWVGDVSQARLCAHVSEQG